MYWDSWKNRRMLRSRLQNSNRITAQHLGVNGLPFSPETFAALAFIKTDLRTYPTVAHGTIIAYVAEHTFW